MEGNNYLTSGDLAMWDTARTSRAGHYYGDMYPCYGRHGGGVSTGIALGAGALGVAVVGGLAIAYGLNQASKARAKAAEQATNLLASNLNQLTSMTIAEKQSREIAVQGERQSRETWQNTHTPTLTQYVDVRSGAFAGAGSSSSAWSQAEANLISGALSGQYARCPQEVTLVSKRNCPCPCDGQ